MAFILLNFIVKENIAIITKQIPVKKNNNNLTDKHITDTKNPNHKNNFLLLNYYQQGKLDDAEKLALTIIKDFPNHMFSWKALGSIFYKQNRKKEALNANQKALNLAPNDFEILNNLGVVLKDLKRSEEAANAFKKALSIKKNYAEAHYNLGSTLKELGKLRHAEKSLREAIRLKPNYVEAYNNLGNTLKELGNLNEAITFLSYAIKLNPIYTEAYNNLGVVLLDIGKIKESITIFKKAINHKPKYFEAHNNLGTAYQEIGNAKGAITSYIKAIKINPNYIEAWNNIYFPLQIIKSEKNYTKSYLSSLLKKELPETTKVYQSLLKYKLNIGGVKSEYFFNKAIFNVSTNKNIPILNPKPANNCYKKTNTNSKKIIALLHFGRSGTGLVHSLIDNHTEISTLPSIYLSEFFNESMWDKIIANGWYKIIDNFIANYPVLFDARSSYPVPSISGNYNYNFGFREGMTKLGKNKDEFLYIDKVLFKKELNNLISEYKFLNQIIFFKLLHEAYEKVINNYQQKRILFYHIHNPGIYAKINFIDSAPDTKWLIMVRDPIESCESWIHEPFNQDNIYRRISSRIITVLFDIDRINYKDKNVIGLRLEDLKKYPKKAIPALCDWMGIKEEKSLYEMTAQGKKWWGDVNTHNITAFGKINKSKVGKIFSRNDRFILKTLFYPFNVRFCYAEENLVQFKSDLKKIRPMIDEIFDFEKKFINRNGINIVLFKKSIMYLYMRSRMIERWEVLNKYNTYPNMLKSLKI